VTLRPPETPAPVQPVPDLPVDVTLHAPAGDLEATFRNLATSRLYAMTLLPRAGKGVVGAVLTVNVVVGLLPVVFVIATSLLLGHVPAAVRDGVDSRAWQSLLTAFFVAAGVFVAQQLAAPLVSTLSDLVSRRVDRAVYDELMSASLHNPDLAALEDQDIQDDLRVAGLKLEFGVQSPGNACAGMLALVARYTQLVAFAAVVGAAYSWIAAVGLIAAVLVIRQGMRGGLSRYADARRRLARAERRADYLRNLAIRPGAAMEIRVFGLASWLTEVYRTVYLTWLRPLWRARRRILLWSFLAFASWGLAVAVVVLAVVGATAATTLSLAGFALVVQSVLGALRLSGFYPEADMQTAVGISGYDQVRRFVTRIAAYARPVTSPAESRVPPPRSEIHFDRVTFRYPGGSKPVLDEFDLTVPAGRCTAIVGVNGAGKTTLVKLLARLYEPEGGAVRIDGEDIRRYDVDAWRARLAVIFQEFLRYEATVAENIGFGAVEHLGDRAGIHAAAESVGLGEAIDRLPNGLDTLLASHMAGGAELSGGQWQRVALARALFAVRHGAPVVVLDEPTASLDMRSEARFFEQFAELTRGTTTLLISHRFSTVRHADHIVVVDGGRVVEQGDHAELLARDGRYASLFRLQAGRLAGGDAESVEVTV
jgi:ATP-binding cassette subfamily B protein